MRSRLLVLAFALGGLVACAGQEGIGEAGDSADVARSQSSEPEGGIGGTGAPSRERSFAKSDEKEGGIGGTGIFGTVTAFGSIIVNGQVIDINDDAPSSEKRLVGRDLPMSVGSTVIVEATSDGTLWTADRVSLFLPIVGPMTAIDPDAGIVVVMGTPVVLGDDAALVDRRGYADGKVIGLSALSPGDRLAVSGIWNGGEVIASRIDRLEDEGPHGLRGLLLKTGETAFVGGTPLDDACCDRLKAPAFFSAVGEFIDGRFNIGRAEVGSAFLFRESVDQLIVEGYLARDPDGVGFHLSGFGLPADQSSPVKARPGVRSLFVGRYDDAFRIQQSIALPDDRTERIDLLRSLDDLAGPE